MIFFWLGLDTVSSVIGRTSGCYPIELAGDVVF